MRQQAPAIALGLSRVFQHHHVKARAHLVEKQPAVDLARVGLLRGMGQDVIQRGQGLLRHAQGFDKIIARSGGNNAQGRGGAHQPPGHLQGRAVAADGQHHVHPRFPGRLGQGHGVAAIFRHVQSAGNALFHEKDFHPRSDLLSPAAARGGIANRINLHCPSSFPFPIHNNVAQNFPLVKKKSEKAACAAFSLSCLCLFLLRSSSGRGQRPVPTLARRPALREKQCAVFVPMCGVLGMKDKAGIEPAFRAPAQSHAARLILSRRDRARSAAPVRPPAREKGSRFMG